MWNIKRLLYTALILSFVTSGSLLKADQIWNVDWSGSDTLGSGATSSLTAVVTTQDTLTTPPGAYLITGITGSWLFNDGQGNVDQEQITGLQPSLTNFLYPNSPYVDQSGISFLTNGNGFDGSGDVTLFLETPSNQVCENNDSYNVCGAVTVSQGVASTPEPASVGLACIGLLALAGLLTRSKTRSAN